MPKPLFELAPKWGKQLRKAFPSPAKSDLRKVTKGATFAPLPSVNTILRPVSSATTAKSPLSASPEAPPTATSIASPIFGNMNPLPALRRAMSDLIPQRPAYPYDPLFDNYAPEQPFHIQWRRGGVDGQ
ncbi:hypothetical protein MCOR09_007450 [Pyricularia oryzae]|nr:hypothetical protein MCOR09_007450 [Pyricularia oryzae]